MTVGNDVAVRLYDLLDTLVAMRLDFGGNAGGKAAALALGPEKIEGIQVMLPSSPQRKSSARSLARQSDGTPGDECPSASFPPLVGSVQCRRASA
jgi:hypothetical protein